jgi:hypothetical protein
MRNFITKKIPAWLFMQSGLILNVSFKPVSDWLKTEIEYELFDSSCSLEFVADWYSGEYHDVEKIRSEDIKPLIKEILLERYGVR